MPIHLKINPQELSPKVLAVGDPERAKIVAETFLKNKKEINKNRGLLAYSGEYDGEMISVVTHGMGMPSAMIVFEELQSLGAKAILRLGTTGALRNEINIGDAVLAVAAGHFNSSSIRQYVGGEITPPNATSPELFAILKKHLERNSIKHHAGPIISSDAFYAETKETAEKLGKLGFLSIEMECAGLTMLGWMRGFKTGCLLYVTDSLVEGKKGIIGSEDVNKNMLKLAKVSLDALRELTL